MLIPSKGVRELCANMVNHPHDWRQGAYTFGNVNHPDINIWTANGVFYIQIHGTESLTLIEKFALRRAMKLSMARRLNTQPQRGQEGGE